MDTNAEAYSNKRKLQLTWKDVEGEESKNNSSLNAESVVRSSQKIEHEIRESRQKDWNAQEIDTLSDRKRKVVARERDEMRNDIEEWTKSAGIPVGWLEEVDFYPPQTLTNVGG